MEVIRIFHTDTYDERRQRFNSLAFKPTGRKNPGISVIDASCILDSGNTICDHIEQYYGGIASVPPVFWRFNTNILPSQCIIEQEDSNTGDVCHHNITGLTQKEARSFFQGYSANFSLFRICDPAGARVLVQHDVS